MALRAKKSSVLSRAAGRAALEPSVVGYFLSGSLYGPSADNRPAGIGPMKHSLDLGCRVNTLVRPAVLVFWLPYLSECWLTCASRGRPDKVSTHELRLAGRVPMSVRVLWAFAVDRGFRRLSGSIAKRLDPVSRFGIHLALRGAGVAASPPTTSKGGV